MKRLLAVMDALLEAYESSTPCIDQKLVDRVLKAREWAIKGLLVIAFWILAAGPAHAFDKSMNPDRVPSIGLDLWKGQVAGLDRQSVETNGGTVGGLLDYRMPVSNALSVHFFGESEGINNNLKYTDGYRIGVGMRVFLQ